MAESPSAPAYEPALQYDVVLKAPVTISGLKFLPLDQHEMSGAFLNRIVAEHPDAVESAVAR
ncbi:MAG TPA: hypothetical protein VNZ94_01730 [Xanthobacteraceae bacterium]|nr:hypothetical protein [Xanthobacteraceae bacterium]